MTHTIKEGVSFVNGFHQHSRRRTQRWVHRQIGSFSAIAGIISLGASPLFATSTQHVIETEQATIQQGRVSQNKVDAMDEEAARLLRQYQDMRRQTESLQLFNGNLDAMVTAQIGEIASLEQQIANVQVTQREIVPLMLRMLDALEGFIERDIPFQHNERAARLQGLRALMSRPDVDVAAKFRQIMDAYQKESEYSRTIESYQGELNLGGQLRNVEFLRVGRLAYVYQTIDHRESGQWNREKQQWEALDDDYLRAIRQGIRMAKRQAAPQLIELPVMVSGVQP
ncbi:DUF3450 domain-containing protein [Chrysiogenes arsenatis]|uniref:DUF3450 domain-containing protein n=1 Tax=Chrysiogenes arsenatis TaxID=309797 RepID=UPI000A03B8B4|nr:DUF3450 domain-containing protein [Chrysiogenes arsenatis]